MSALIGVVAACMARGLSAEESARVLDNLRDRALPGTAATMWWVLDQAILLVMNERPNGTPRAASGRLS